VEQEIQQTAHRWPSWPHVGVPVKNPPTAEKWNKTAMHSVTSNQCHKF